MSVVELSQVTKKFGDVIAVDSIDLTIADGEFVVFVGPSGCGKSTTLRMIAGLEETSGGTIRIGERDVTWLEPKDRNIAMVFQNYALYAHKNVYDNLGFGLKVRGFDAAEIDKRVKNAAAMLGIEELLRRKPKQLSGGQKQRVALGRALVREPEVFLLDEPLSNLDAKMRVRMREEIAKLHAATGASMVYVTHDQIEAMTLGDRIVVMRDGRVQQIGAPLEIYDRPANIFVASFIGSPEMNLVPGRISTQGGRASVDCGGFPLLLSGSPDGAVNKEVTVGIRPEHLAFGDGADTEVRVELVEQMGAQTLAICKTTHDTKIQALLGRNDSIRKGAAIHLRTAPEHIHIFDQETERSLLGR